MFFVGSRPRGLRPIALSLRCAASVRRIMSDNGGTGYIVCVPPRCRAIVGVPARRVWHGRGMLSGLPSPSVQKVEVARVGQNCCAGCPRGRFQLTVLVISGTVELPHFQRTTLGFGRAPSEHPATSSVQRRSVKCPCVF